ncbi:hypothetical protein HMPREF9166_0009 [Selenomonas sp. oral taxon 149 str. 67H29BP]|nr:hypothetical protein HMPREF9166_0009 [Selenomonas sp. oral taxon 149 str. 67H29BP]
MEQQNLSTLCLIITKGTTPTTVGCNFVNHGVNFVKAESIQKDHTIAAGKLAHIDDKTHATLSRSVIKEKDILFTIAGTLGRFSFIDESLLPANTNQAVAIIRVNQAKIPPEYIYSLFIGNWHNNYYVKHIQQAVQANLSLATIKSLPIPMLPDSDMKVYIKMVSPIISLMQSYACENSRLQTLRDTLLPRLMSGELDVSSIEL